MSDQFEKPADQPANQDAALDDDMKPGQPESAAEASPRDDHPLTEIEEPPQIGLIAELREPPPDVDESQPLARKPVNRRDLLKAAAALGLAAGAASETDAFERRGSISYVVCNRVFNAPVKKVGFSPGNSRLATLSQTGQLRLWDTRQLGKPMDFGPSNTGRAAGDGVSDFVWGKNERLLAIRNDKLTCYDGANLNKLLFDLSAAGVMAAAFTPDGNQIITIDRNWRIQLLDAATGKKTAEYNIAPQLQSLPDKVRPGTVSFPGMTRESPGRIYLATKKNILLVNLSPLGVEVFPDLVADFDELLISGNGEMVGYLQAGEKMLHIFAFPSGYLWKIGVQLNSLGEKWDLSPAFDSLLTATGGNIRMQRLNDQGAAQKQWESAANLNSVTCLACGWDPDVYAWGGDDGRVLVGKEPDQQVPEAGQSDSTNTSPRNASQVKPDENRAAIEGDSTNASPGGGSLLKTVLVDATVNKVKESKAGEAQLPYDDCKCTCNSVSVTSSHNDRITQTFDTVRQQWTTSTQPCGSPLPAGAVCLCNCVRATSSPIWRTICTCNTVCTCNPQSTGYTLSYWY